VFVGFAVPTEKAVAIPIKPNTKYKISKNNKKWQGLQYQQKRPLPSR
jgi:hypothetical protein